MPELMDVEGFKAQLDRGALDRPVREVHVSDTRILDEDLSPQALGRRLKDRSLSQSLRHGKYLLADSGDGWLVMHFGMTGSLTCCGKSEDPPDETVAVFRFRDGGCLAYACRRMLGRLSWTAGPESFIRDQDLGPDALDPDLESDDFAQRFDGRSGMLKPALMNQSILAGIGNILSDEILFQCRLHPKTRVSDLDHDEIKGLFRPMRRILRTEARAHREGRPVPDSYLGPHRRTDRECPRCGGSLASTTVSGRTSHYCPACQG